MDNVVFSFLGSQLDASRRVDRWSRWRPNVAMCQQQDLVVNRLELLHGTRHAELADLVCEDIASVSPETEVRRTVVDLQDPWDLEEVYGALYELAVNYAFAPELERYLVNLTTGTHISQICWFLLTESRYIPAELLQLSPPASKRSGDAAGSYQLIDLDLSKYDQIAGRFAAERDDGTSFLKAGINTRNRAFNDMIGQIEKVAIRSDAPVLLMGPTGAGKSQLARRIYELKKVRHQLQGTLVEVNCATLRGDNAMSALFGHKRGAFTGAAADRPGLLRAADGGLLFLDEVGELGLDEQAMILRAVEDKRFLPVGADKESHSDFQLIAGTNRDLREECTLGHFREDLLARLDLWTYELPGLRERTEDIEGNIEFELRSFALKSGNHVAFNKESAARYLKFATSPHALWLGNFRDLSASVTRMATLAEGGRITDSVVADEIVRLQRAWTRNNASKQRNNDVLDSVVDTEHMDLFDRVQLAEVVRTCARANSMSAAGRELFEHSRLSKKSNNDADRLRKYLARFGLNWSAVKAARS